MKIALIGYGKMGRMIEEIALSRGHEIVSIIDIDNQDEFESPAFASADVAIEFTAPQVAYDNYLKAFSKNVKVVSGSTGWIPLHGDDVRRMCNEEGKTLFWSSNFSLGVTIFRAVNRYLARIMNQFADYTPSLEEVHHIHKLDHPSLDCSRTLTEQGKVPWLSQPTNSVSTVFVEMKCLVFIVLHGKVRPTASPSPMMLIAVKASRLVQFLPQNTRLSTTDY